MSEFHPHVHLEIERLDALLRRALVFNHIGDAMVVVAPDGTIRDWNQGAEQIFGWSRDEALGQPPGFFHRAEDASALWPSIRTAVLRDGRWSGTHTFVTKDGTEAECTATALPLIDSAGNVWGTLLALTETAAAAPAEAAAPPPADAPALPAERFLIRTLIDAVPDPIFCKDREGRYLLHNDADRSMFWHTDEACIGKTVMELPGDKDIATLYYADDLRVIQTGQPIVNREEPYETKDGRKGWFLTSKFPVRDEAGQIIGLVGIARDITAMKQATAELKEAQLRLIYHIENSPLAVVEWEPDFRITRWAGQAESIFGWTAEEVVGRHFSEFPFVHPEDAEKVNGVVERLIDGRDRRNISHNRNLTKRGLTVHCAWQNSVLLDAAGRSISILSLVQDVPLIRQVS